MEKHVIIITGPPAAGKTTFSEYLSEKLQVIRLNKDYIKETLCDAIGYANRAENKKLSIAAYNMIKHIAEQSMQAGQPAILESNFTAEECYGLAALIKKYNYTAITVLFDGDMRVLHTRYLERLDSPTRHIAHRSAGLGRFEDFQSAVEPLREFDLGGHRINVDTTNFAAVDYNDILARVKALL